MGETLNAHSICVGKPFPKRQTRSEKTESLDDIKLVHVKIGFDNMRLVKLTEEYVHCFTRAFGDMAGQLF